MEINFKAYIDIINLDTIMLEDMLIKLSTYAHIEHSMFKKKKKEKNLLFFLD